MKSSKKKMPKRKRQVIKIVGLLVLIILILVLSVVAFAMSKLAKLDRISIGKRDVQINQDMPEETKKSMKGYTTLALFGLDNRSNGSFQSGNSDTIIIASINHDTGEIRMASVYRDTFLDIGEGGVTTACLADTEFLIILPVSPKC